MCMSRMKEAIQHIHLKTGLWKLLLPRQKNFGTAKLRAPQQEILQMQLRLMLQEQDWNPTLVKVKGAYDDVNRLCTEISESFPEIAFANINLRPYYGDGSKTMGFEIAEQLGWKAPAHFVVPMAGGSLITKIGKAFNDLYWTGLIDEPKTRAYGAQP